MHRVLLYGAFGFLLLTGVLHFFVDVVHQYVSGHRPPGPETTFYYGLHSAYALGQVAFGGLAILLVRSGSDLMSRVPGQVVTFLVLLGWAAVCVLFIEYVPPRVNLAVVAALFVAATVTA